MNDKNDLNSIPKKLLGNYDIICVCCPGYTQVSVLLILLMQKIIVMTQIMDPEIMLTPVTLLHSQDVRRSIHL